LKKIKEAEQQCENYILEQAAGLVFRGIGVLPRTAVLPLQLLPIVMCKSSKHLFLRHYFCFVSK
jgi:hypothetical protein